MIFKVAPTFMSGSANSQNMFGFSQNDKKIVAKVNKVWVRYFPELKLEA
jgi:hypothetical protein